MRVSLRLLLVEDSPADAELAVEELRASSLDVVARRVETPEEFTVALDELVPEAILFDHGVPGFSAVDALEILHGRGLPTPFIVVTGGLSEREAVACIHAGADDIVLKSEITRLREAVDRALTLREGLSRLSPRQMEVLRLVAEGRTTPEIARELEISVKTADTHRTHMMRRLDIHDVAGLVRYAMQVRLVPSPR